MYEKEKGTELVLRIGEKTIKWTSPYEDHNVTDILDVLRGLLVAHTFIDTSFITACGEFYDEHKWMLNEDDEEKKEDV